MPQILTLVLKNCMRNKLRTVLTILGTAVAVIAFGFLQTVLAAYYVGAEASSPNRLVTRHRVSLFNPLPLAQRDKIAAIPGVSKVSYANWFGGYYKTPDDFFAKFAAEDGYIDLYPEFIMPPDQKRAYMEDRQGAVVGRKLADRFGWKIGDRVTLTGDAYPGTWDFIIRAIYHGRDRTTDETSMFFHWKLVDESVRAGRRSQVGWYLIGIEKPSDTGRIMKGVDDQFINSTAPTLTETEKSFNQEFISMMGSIITIIKAAAWIVIVIILLIMTNTMAMSARERTTEYGVLKTLGFRAPQLTMLIGGEALFVSLMGGAVGCAFAFGAVAAMGKSIESSMGSIFPVFEMTPLTVLLALLMALLAGLAASTVPVVRAIKLPIADALRRIG